MAGNLCRCGTYLSIVHAIERAAKESAAAASPPKERPLPGGG